MLVKSYAAAVQGISATVVTVEVNCSKGIQFFLVGLPDVAVRESHERIISALQVCGYKFPRNRIVINMGSPDKPGGLSIQLCKSEKKEFYIRYSS